MALISTEAQFHLSDWKSWALNRLTTGHGHFYVENRKVEKERSKQKVDVILTNRERAQLVLYKAGGSGKVSKWNQTGKSYSIQQRPKQLTQTQNCWTSLEMSCKQRISSIFCLKFSRSPSSVIYCQFPLRAWNPIAISLWRALAVLEKLIKWRSQQNFNKQSD